MDHGRAQLNLLLPARRFPKHSLTPYGASCCQPADVPGIIGERRVGDYLQVFHAGAVVYFDERKPLRVTPGANPTVYGNGFTHGFSLNQIQYSEFKHDGLYACSP